MVSFLQFLNESGPEQTYENEFSVEKGGVVFHFARKTAEKDNKEYLQFQYADTPKTNNPEIQKKIEYINQFKQKSNFFPSRKFENKSIDDVIRFIKNPDTSFEKLYNEIDRLRNSKRAMFTKNDLIFKESYSKLVKSAACSILEDGKVKFPFIDKVIENVDIPEGYGSLRKYLNFLERDFEKKANIENINEDSGESLENGSYDDDEDYDEENSESSKKEWQKREEQVKDTIDGAIQDFKNKYKITNDAGANAAGGSEQSDVVVNSGGDERFFVEVKLNYEDAAYLKFNIRYDGKNIVRTRLNKDDEKFNANFSKKMTDLVVKNLNGKFDELKKNVEYWIQSFREVTKDNGKIGKNVVIDPEKATMFPDAFDELSKAFNFFILEWSKKFKVCKSNYVYYLLSGQEKDAENTLEIAKGVAEKLKTLANGQEILEMDAFQKFRSLYVNFISMDKTKYTKQNRYVLFSFDSHEFENGKTSSDDNKTRDQLIDLIQEYYNEKRHVEYIQVDDDLYKIKKDDPFSLNVPLFSNLKGVYKISGQEKSIVKMDVRIVAADTLHLDMRLTKPKRFKTQKSFVGQNKNKFTSNDIEKTPFGDKISNAKPDSMEENNAR